VALLWLCCGCVVGQLWLCCGSILWVFLWLSEAFLRLVKGGMQAYTASPCHPIRALSRASTCCTAQADMPHHLTGIPNRIPAPRV